MGEGPDREDDVVRRDGYPVVPPHAVTQPHGPLAVIRGVLPPLGKDGRRLAAGGASLVVHEWKEEQELGGIVPAGPEHANVARIEDGNGVL